MESFIVDSKEELKEFMLWCYHNNSIDNAFGSFQKSPDIEKWASLFSLEFPAIQESDLDEDEYEPEELLQLVDWKDFKFPCIVCFEFGESFDRTGDVIVEFLNIQPVRDFKDFVHAYDEAQKEEERQLEQFVKYKEARETWKAEHS